MSPASSRASSMRLRPVAKSRFRWRAGPFAFVTHSSRISPNISLQSALLRGARRCSSSIRRPMQSTASKTPATFLQLPNIRKVVFQQEITAGRHRFLADEPIAVGGLDSGPGPYDLLLAGLGACTSMTLRLYAQHKASPLDHVTVRLSHARIHAVDC